MCASDGATKVSEGADTLSPSPDIEAVIRKARKVFRVYRTSPTTLLLDLDNGTEVYDKVLPVIAWLYGAKEKQRWKSRNGNLHIEVTLRDRLPFEERVGLQAMLGSDPVREALSLKRAHEGQTEPSILFRPKS